MRDPVYSPEAGRRSGAAEAAEKLRGDRVAVSVEADQRRKRRRDAVPGILVMTFFADPAEICMVKRDVRIIDGRGRQHGRPVMRDVTEPLAAVHTHPAVDRSALGDERGAAAQPRLAGVEPSCPGLTHTRTPGPFFPVRRLSPRRCPGNEKEPGPATNTLMCLSLAPALKALAPTDVDPMFGFTETAEDDQISRRRVRLDLEQLFIAAAGRALEEPVFHC